MRVRVPRCVVERLLRHAIEAQGHGLRNISQAVVGVEHDLDRLQAPEFGANPLERHHEPKVLEHGRVQPVRKVPNRLGQRCRFLLESVDLDVPLSEIRR